MIHNKAIVEMDGQQIKLQMHANGLGYLDACIKGDFHRADQYRIMNDQLEAKLKQFHEQHAKAFAERYPINVQIFINGLEGC
jgi:hypothetical protein